MAALQKELESKEERLSLASAGTDTLQEQLDALRAELETERLNTQRVSPLLVKQEKNVWKPVMRYIGVHFSVCGIKKQYQYKAFNISF